MCKNKTWIYTKYGKKVLVECGKCPACLQKRAIGRVNRIRNNVRPGRQYLFVTLTYSNQCVPYFNEEDYLSAKAYKATQNDPYTHEKEGILYKSVPLYRDSFVRRVRVDGAYKTKAKIVSDRQYLQDISIPYFEDQEFSYLRNQPYKKVSICYFKDVQDFIKRLRINLQRYCESRYLDSHYEDDFSFFACTEYGPSTCRAHIHLLLDIPFGLYSVFKHSIVKSWSYDRRVETSKGVQIARDAAGYVASYVNRSKGLPSALAFSFFRQKCSYSKGYGFGLDAFSFPKVLEKFNRGSLRYTVTRNRDKSVVVDDFVLPKYVISRYFPQIKGYRCLTSDEIICVCQTPELLELFKDRLDYDDKDLKTNIVRIRNKVNEFRSYLSPLDYGIVYSRIWSMRSSNILEDSYKPKNKPKLNQDIFYAYDNIEDFLVCKVHHYGLAQEFWSLPPELRDIDTDPNEFPESLAQDLILSDAFEKYSKDKKVRNEILSINHNF